MGNTTPYFTESDLLRKVANIEGTAVDATPLLLGVGGAYNTLLAPVDAGDAVRLALEPRGHLTPALGPILLDSLGSVTGSGIGTYLAGIRGFKQMIMLVDVSTVGGTTPTLTLYVDSRLDGTSTINIGRFSDIIAVGTSIVALTKEFSTNQAVINGSLDAGAGTFRAVGWGDDIRIRRNVEGTSPTFTARVWIHLVG